MSNWSPGTDVIREALEVLWTRLIGPRAHRADGADRAGRFTGLAGSPAVRLNQMTEARPTRLRDHLGELVVNSLRIVGAGETEALGHAEDVSVDGDRGLVERVAEHDVGSLQSDTGECDERITGSGNLAPVAIDKRLRRAARAAS